MPTISQIEGIGPVNAAKLSKAGVRGTNGLLKMGATRVDTVPELAARNPEALLEALTKVNAKKNLVNQLPGLNNVKAWIKNAKSLKRIVEY